MLRNSEAYGWPPADDVDFRFSPHENFTQNANRILLGQIQHAINCVHAAMDPERAVHACRLATKRIEAVLLLLGNGSESKTLRKQAQVLKKLLSKYRDSTVLRSHVAELPTSKTRYHALAQLDAKRAELYGDFGNITAPVLLEQLELLVNIAKRIVVPNGFSTLEPGFTETYAQARLGVVELSSSLPKAAKQLHHWRTQVKRHGYHLELLMPCAPLYFEPRLLAVNHIGHCLGEYHDLELTQREVSKPKVRRRIRAQQNQYLVDSLALQRWAMQPKPAIFLNELKQRWALWHRTSR
jgi:CHAD domain-containing protein